MNHPNTWKHRNITHRGAPRIAATVATREQTARPQERQPPPGVLAEGFRDQSRSLLIAHLAVAGSCACAIIGAPHLLEFSEALFLGGLVCAALTGWCLWSWWILKQPLFGPYAITLLAMFMYHEGQFILRMCGIETGLHGLQFDVSRYSAETLVSAQILIVSGIGGLHAGALLVARLKLTGTSGVVVLSRDPDRPMQARLVGWILCIVSIIPELMYLKALLALRATGTYGELYDRELATGINNWQSVIGLAIVPGSLFMLAGSKGSPLTLAFSVIFICVHVGGFALVGLRSEAVLPILAFTWVFHKAVRALPRLFLLVGALLAVIVLPLLGVLRFTSLDQLSVDEVTSRYLTIENPLVSFIDETGISAVTVADTVELVPRERTYELGLGYLNALVQPLHFLVPLDLTGGYGLPSIWLAEARYRTMYEHGAAMGYSVVAEAYLEFSWVGPFLVLCGIGAIVARLESWCSRPPDVLRIAAVGYLVSILPHLTRQSVGDFVSPIFRYAVLPYLAGLLILGWRHHRAGRTGLHGEAREGTTTLYVM